MERSIRVKKFEDEIQKRNFRMPDGFHLPLAKSDLGEDIRSGSHGGSHSGSMGSVPGESESRYASKEDAAAVAAKRAGVDRRPVDIRVTQVGGEHQGSGGAAASRSSIINSPRPFDVPKQAWSSSVVNEAEYIGVTPPKPASVE